MNNLLHLRTMAADIYIPASLEKGCSDPIFALYVYDIINNARQQKMH